MSFSRRPTRVRQLSASGAVALLAVALTGALGRPASAASPSLVLTVGPAPYFMVGQAGSNFDGCGGPGEYSYAPAALYVSATSTSTIKKWTVTSEAEAGPTGKAVKSKTSPDPITWQPSNYDFQCGGNPPGQPDAWKVSVRDAAGDSATVTREYGFRIYDWNNAGVDGGSWTFSSGWATSTCSCADGGSMAKTATAGASGSFLEQVSTAGTHLGLMMATGPTRGQAAIYVDGTKKATVDTYASQNANEIYEWDSGPLSTGQHTIEVVNLATSGRPNIYVNAIGELS